jgi:hypothetical protein
VLARLNLLNAIISATAATFVFATVWRLTGGSYPATVFTAGRSPELPRYMCF